MSDPATNIALKLRLAAILGTPCSPLYYRPASFGEWYAAPEVSRTNVSWWVDYNRWHGVQLTPVGGWIFTPLCDRYGRPIGKRGAPHWVVADAQEKLIDITPRLQPQLEHRFYLPDQGQGDFALMVNASIGAIELHAGHDYD